MSRIPAGECQYLDIEWYAVDGNGNIAVFCSGGAAGVPEFVCEDEERRQQLVKLFRALPECSQTALCFTPSLNSPRVSEVAKQFSGKGLYYYDADDGSRLGENVSVLKSYYTVNAKPLTPIKFEDLPCEMQELLTQNR